MLTSCGEDNTQDLGQEQEFVFEFEAVDIFGNSVNQDTIGEKDIYFIYLWATWCPPCVRSMPDMAEIVDRHGDRVGFVGLLLDYDSNVSGAVNIVTSAGVPEEFVMINAEESSVRELYDAVRTGFVPASIVMTADGKFLPISAPYGSGLDKILQELS